MIILIDTMYKTVNVHSHGNTFLFWFKYMNKKELIKELKHYKKFVADGRTSYRLIEDRFNGVEK